MFNRLVVDHVAVTGFKAWVTRDSKGNFNFNDLIQRSAPLSLAGPVLAAPSLPMAVANATEQASASSASSADFQIDIAGLDLKNGEIHLYDNVTGSIARIVKLDVNTGRMTFDQAFDVALKGKLVGELPVADANINGQALIKFNPEKKTYSAQKLNLVVAGQVGTLQAKAATLRGNLAYSAYSQMFSASEIGRAHVCTPVTNEQLVCRLLLEKK